MCLVTVNAHGPLRIEGDFTIVDAEGRPLDLKGRTSLALCRCGASKHKPFCDGTHNTVNFRSIVTGDVTGDR
ncbi:MAG: CDGSH iron-sulfur domain-containing protein [Gemmatimonadota bacterium]